MPDDETRLADRDRIDRLEAHGAKTRSRNIPAREHEDAPALDAPVSILVVPVCPDGRLSPADNRVIGLARRIQELHFAKSSLSIAVFGTIPEGLDLAGADRVYAFPTPGIDPLCEVRAGSLATLVQQVCPTHVLFAYRAGVERAMMLTVAARLQFDLVPHVHHVSLADLTLRAETAHPGISLVQPLAKLNEIQSGCGEPWHGAIRALRIIKLPLAARNFPVTELAEVSEDPEPVPLAEAEFIVSAGNGVDDLELFERFSNALGATPGASRVLVDAGKALRSRQVGSSGTITRARVYVAVGISGAPQHLLGVEACNYVIAINTDPNCSMVRRADLAIIADANSVMRAVLARCDDLC